ncbi:MAG TPA: thiamine diphosphokinase [Pseudogracilibacillus sp.]|nr:thiamine diphosphokinase [Pseudogracilibacillus sp.]
MKSVAIVANGPKSHIPILAEYKHKIDCWIGADRGASIIIEQGLPLYKAVGDFDSVTKQEIELIKEHTDEVTIFPSKKNETDLELAIREALLLNPSHISFFGMSGGRLDHGLINIQLLYPLLEKGINATIIDNWNEVQLMKPGTHIIEKKNQYPYLSLIPFTPVVEGVSLDDSFLYTLLNETIEWGSTLCISNELCKQEGTLHFESGRLLMIQSKDSKV